MANDLRKRKLLQSTAYKEKESKTVCFDSPGRYEWLREVEVSEPIHLQELRNHSRMFLEKVKVRSTASDPVDRRQTEKCREPAKPVLRSTSLPLPNTMHPQQEGKSHGRDDINKETAESQATGYEWWKEVEVRLPDYFLKRRKERLLVKMLEGLVEMGRKRKNED